MIGHYTTRAGAVKSSSVSGLRLSKLVAADQFSSSCLLVKTNQFGPGVTIPERNSKSKGDATEAKVIYELVTRGYAVSVPFGDNEKYDLVLDDDGRFYRVQCKTAWLSDRNTIRFNTHSQTTKNGEYHEASYDGDIDAFIVRNPADEQLYWIDIQDANSTRMDLNYSAAIDHPSINWAPDFELGEAIPPSRG